MKMMKLIVSMCLLSTLVGCGTYGEPLLLSALFDSQDPCQTRNRGPNYQQPSYCGAANYRTYIYNNNGYPVGFVKR